MHPTIETNWSEIAARLDRYIRSKISDPAAAEDIRQDVFLRMHQRLDQLRSLSKLDGWLFLIARNAIIDYYRTRKKGVAIPDSLSDEEAAETAGHDQLKAAFRRMIHELPEPYREAIVLTEFDGMTQQELARKLGISLSGAKSRVQRGRKLLKDELLACCRFEFDRRGKVLDCEPRGRKCPECS